jgi:hypothetical protein
LELTVGWELKKFVSSAAAGAAAATGKGIRSVKRY